MRLKVSLPLLIVVIVLVTALVFTALSLMRIISREMGVKVEHFCVKVVDFWAVGFTIKSPEAGVYRYSMSYNSSIGTISYSDEGYIEPPNSFTYAVDVSPEPNRVIVVNIRVWWGEQLIDEVNHYIRADDK